MSASAPAHPLPHPQVPAHVVRHLRLLRSRIMDTDLLGSYRSSFRGAGLEFREVKPFEMGDEVRSIDWNVTARMQRPYVRHFDEERSLRLVLALDTSASMTTPGLGRTKREVMRDTAFLIAQAAAMCGDRFSHCRFGRHTSSQVPFSARRKALWHMLRTIAEHPFDEQHTDYVTLIQQLAQHNKRRAALFIFSDFLFAPEHTDLQHMATLLRTLRGRHEVIMVSINDPIEWHMPDRGLLWAQNPEGGEPVLLDTSSKVFRREYEKRGRQIRSFRKHLFSKAQVDHIELSTNEDLLIPLGQFFRRRARR